MNPNIALIWNNNGTALYYLGKYQDVLAAYNKALSIDPSNRQLSQSKIGSAATNPVTNNTSTSSLPQPSPQNTTTTSK